MMRTVMKEERFAFTVFPEFLLRPNKPVKIKHKHASFAVSWTHVLVCAFFSVCSSKRLVTLARGLSPAFLRFGGKRTDFLQFNNQKNLAKFRGPGPDYYLKNYEDGDHTHYKSCLYMYFWRSLIAGWSGRIFFCVTIKFISTGYLVTLCVCFFSTAFISL